MGFNTPTPIQGLTIPSALEKKDILACAQTGTGKTGAFCIPIITRLVHEKHTTACILVPTRELALQVNDVLIQLLKFLPEIRSAVLIGGAPMHKQTLALKRHPRILVATPGRLIDHLRQGTASLKSTGVLVLDEADRMLDMGFAPQLNQIMKFVPRERQTMLLSATLPSDILKLSAQYLNHPVKVEVEKQQVAAATIEQKHREVEHTKKNDALLDELNARQGSVLVFVRTQSRTDRLARYLEKVGIEAARIHGGRSQGQRNRALQGFRDGDFRVLVATDIAARGIDIDHVAHVINYDLPQVAEDYVHRIGRTGRNGRTGEAMSLITPEDRPLWREIRKLLGHAVEPAGQGSQGHSPQRRQDSRRNSQPRRGGGGRHSGQGQSQGQKQAHGQVQSQQGRDGQQKALGIGSKTPYKGSHGRVRPEFQSGRR